MTSHTSHDETLIAGLGGFKRMGGQKEELGHAQVSDGDEVLGISVPPGAKAKTLSALRTLLFFASFFNESVGEIQISVEPEAGFADSGDLEHDLSELFVIAPAR